jgi:TetR/AcrR family tetracycline transcriptional repressor
VSFISLPGPEPARKRPPLDRDQVVAAALGLLDEAGLDELTMRRLADRLGIKAASLYRHVRDKDELLALLADAINAEIPLPRASAGWRDRLAEMAANARRGLLAHRDGARLVATTAPVGAARLRHIESVMKALRDAGLGKREVVRAAYHLNNFITEFVADEQRFAMPAAERRKAFAGMRRQLEGLPAAEFPTLRDLAAELTEHDPDGNFRFGLEIWLDAIGRLAKG